MDMTPVSHSGGAAALPDHAELRLLSDTAGGTRDDGDGNTLFPPGACIGDYCTPDSSALKKIWTEDSDSGSDDDGEERSEKRGFLMEPACEADLLGGQRVFLMMLARMFSGTTALEGVLMSSRHFSTLCEAKDWQCEGSRLMNRSGYELSVKSWDIDDMLRIYSKYWDLNRPVLFDKSPRQMLAVEKVREGLIRAELPQRMKRTGVNALTRAYILLWRPICMMHLSGHAKKSMEEIGKSAMARKELTYYQTFVQKHRYLMEQGEPVLVISVGELLWRPKHTQNRLQKFLPCLGKLDMDYVPQLGRDVFAGNDWKAHGSVKAFGKSVDPSSFYDVDSGTCHGEEDLFKLLDDDAQGDALEATTYLQSFSGLKRMRDADFGDSDSA